MLSLKALTNRLNIECENDFDVVGLNTLKDAGKLEVSFLENKKYKDDLTATKAGAVFVTEDMKDLVPEHCVALVCEHPYLALAKASKARLL